MPSGGFKTPSDASALDVTTGSKRKRGYSVLVDSFNRSVELVRNQHNVDSRSFIESENGVDWADSTPPCIEKCDDDSICDPNANFDDVFQLVNKKTGETVALKISVFNRKYYFT